MNEDIQAKEQQTFDFVVGKIIEQGIPSVNDGGECMYRSENGLKCAAGHLIPDDVYDSEMEGRDVLRLQAWMRRTVFQFDEDVLGLIAALQTAHDGAANAVEDIDSAGFLAQFRHNAGMIAKARELDPGSLK